MTKKQERVYRQLDHQAEINRKCRQKREEKTCLNCKLYPCNYTFDYDKILKRKRKLFIGEDARKRGCGSRSL